MAAKDELETFLRSRNIPDNVIVKLKDDKIDMNVIDLMADEELGQYIDRYGDRLALRAFCRQRTLKNNSGTVKSALMHRVREKIEGRTSTNSDTAVGRPIGNKYAVKDTRRVEMGWLHIQKGECHQVRTKGGGGTRHLSVQKTITVAELLEIGKDLFFPEGHSSKGPIGNFDFDIRDFSQKSLPLDCTINQLYEKTKLRMLRIYTCSWDKNTPIILSDASSDFEPTDARPVKKKARCRYRRRTESTKEDPLVKSSDSDAGPTGSVQATYERKKTKRTETTKEDPLEKFSDSDADAAPTDSVQATHESTGEPTRQSRPAPCEMSDIEVLPSVSNVLVSNELGDQCRYEVDSQIALAINVSLEDFEVQFGGICAGDGGDDDSTLLWNPSDLHNIQHSTLNDEPASSNGLTESPDQSEKELLYVKLRRVNIVHDVLNVFMKPRVLNANLKMELINEKAVDSDGVSREVYSAFWEHFFEQCEGEEERVPRLRPDYSEKEWKAVGKVWLKGYLDHGIMPIRLSPAFVLACCQGVDSVDEELLMTSFARFLSVTERLSIEKALQGSMDESDEEELLDLFSRMGAHCLPSKENLRATIVTMAHKALLQEPKFIIDCFHSSIHTALPTPITKSRLMELYESKKPTNRKVAQMIKPSNESLSAQEQTALNHLLRYVRSIDQKKLETFLRFCTGSTVLCKDKIEVTFNNLCGLSRRPVAHTCGAVLELPCTYSTYPEFRTEFDCVLSGDCFTMDIV
nr:uncharacterized protein LOC129455338 isoform X2 [Misgurnus anguillicaudatus]